MQPDHAPRQTGSPGPGLIWRRRPARVHGVATTGHSSSRPVRAARKPGAGRRDRCRSVSRSHKPACIVWTRRIVPARIPLLRAYGQREVPRLRRSGCGWVRVGAASCMERK
jgi:hypothetical protein